MKNTKKKAGKEKKKDGKKLITKKMSFSFVLEKYPEVTEVFIEEGLYCIGCPMSAMESIEQGCKVHGIDPDKLIEKLNKKIRRKRKR